ncbi:MULTISPECIES: hypothetical protein [Marinovum]|uniref:hypothetical protein n=1 Tax=Marinovum TaxID=367771 RepID=UPI00237B8E65|nr:hypothetical protein [Marinovum sp. PR37]MDD9745512.1 hypothetical protein [Marinovum sp. PR37]
MTERELDEILTLRWPLVMRAAMAGTDDWLKGFVRSIARQGKRAAWKPTYRQEQIMRRLVAEVGTVQPQSSEVIED